MKVFDQNPHQDHYQDQYYHFLNYQALLRKFLVQTNDQNSLKLKF